MIRSDHKADRIETSPTQRIDESGMRVLRFRWNLRTFLLLTGLICVWTSYLVLRSQIATTNAEIEVLSNLVRDLRVSDPTEYALVKQEDGWPDRETWKVYLPQGTSYVLRLSTRQIEDVGFPAEVQGRVIVGSGRHDISIEVVPGTSGWNLTVFIDDNGVLNHVEPISWKPLYAGVLSSSEQTRSQQQASDEPLVLQRSQFIPDSRKSFTTPVGPSNGILLWIEKEKG